MSEGEHESHINLIPSLGRIINNGSIAAHVPRPHTTPYAVSKHAISGLTKATNLDGRKYNVTVTQIDIGEYCIALPLSPPIPARC